MSAAEHQYTTKYTSLGELSLDSLPQTGSDISVIVIVGAVLIVLAVILDRLTKEDS